MFAWQIDEQIELRLLQHSHCQELFKVIDANRKHLSAWHPWIDQILTGSDLERFLTRWLQQFSANRGFYAGIWFEERLCGVVNHLNIDWANRSTVLSYWLDAKHQGRGIMTAACGALVAHAFDNLRLNRVTIECASDNLRSRRVAERLGFRFEGVVRGIEWLHDHYADHAMYGLLTSDTRTSPALRVKQLQQASVAGEESKPVPGGRCGDARRKTADLVPA